MTCKTCGGEMIQKSRARLISVGAAMVALAGVIFSSRWLGAPAAVLLLAGAYLLLWGTLGQGRWCRTCKKF